MQDFEQILQREIALLDQVDQRRENTDIEHNKITKFLRKKEQEKCRNTKSYC